MLYRPTSEKGDDRRCNNSTATQRKTTTTQHNNSNTTQRKPRGMLLSWQVLRQILPRRCVEECFRQSSGVPGRPLMRPAVRRVGHRLSSHTDAACSRRKRSSRRCWNPSQADETPASYLITAYDRARRDSQHRTPNRQMHIHAIGHSVARLLLDSRCSKNCQKRPEIASSYTWI